jgi:hypothetical protein
MFQFLGDALGWLLMLALGVYAYLKPNRLVSTDLPPHMIKKETKRMKYLGLAIVILGGLAFVLQFIAS